jgi:hypothetical protein
MSFRLSEEKIKDAVSSFMDGGFLKSRASSKSTSRSQSHGSLYSSDKENEAPTENETFVKPFKTPSKHAPKESHIMTSLVNINLFSHCRLPQEAMICKRKAKESWQKKFHSCTNDMIAC